jgi:hypothetical protein
MVRGYISTLPEVSIFLVLEQASERTHCVACTKVLERSGVSAFSGVDYQKFLLLRRQEHLHQGQSLIINV